MSLWGNTDSSNNKPHFSYLREVVPVGSFVTANATTAGNTIVFTSNTNFSVLASGFFVYSADANNSVSRSNKDLSILDGNESAFWKSNNTITQIDTANATIRLTNNVMGTLAAGQVVVVGNSLPWQASAGGFGFGAANDVVLVTASRMANTQGTAFGGGSNVANTKIGNVNAGWNRITRKINNDGTVRFLKETLVALANPTAANTQSANTSANAVFAGL